MIRKNKMQLILSSVIILLPIIAGLIFWNKMPESMSVHWGMNGEPDGWGSKILFVFLVPVFLLAIHWFTVFLTAKDPKNKEQNEKVFRIVLWIIPMISLVVNGMLYAVALGSGISIDVVVRILLGLVFVILGNYMPKCSQNHTIGVRVTWALRNKENWNRTHRFAGRLWVTGGVLMLATVFVPVEEFMYVVLAIVLLLSFAPMLYSYLYYRKQLKAGTAGIEDAIPTPREKKFTSVSLAVAAVIVLVVGVLLTTGEIELQYSDTAFEIKADYWENATIIYSEIDQLEYRDQDEPGTREFGFGSFKLLMGRFQNNEFGTYTRYSYAGCDSCVVLTFGDRVLVVNGQDEESTQEIYRELMKRVSE